MSLHIFTPTTCEGWEQSETSEEMLVSVGCPAASFRMSWPLTAARADRRAQHWRLIASNEHHCSPQRRMSLRNYSTLTLCGVRPYIRAYWAPHLKPERERGFLHDLLHSKWKGEIPAPLAGPQHCAKHWSRHKLLNLTWICLYLPFQDRLFF